MKSNYRLVGSATGGMKGIKDPQKLIYPIYFPPDSEEMFLSFPTISSQ